MNIIFASIFTLLAIACMFAFRGRLRSNPVFWYIAFHWLMGIGSIINMDYAYESDQLHLLAFYLSLFFFFAGGYVTWITLKVNENYSNFFSSPVTLDPSNTRAFAAWICGASILITLLYYQAVGRNIFADMVFGVIIEDFASARLSAYSGDEYFAPGYANQFKNVLFPVTYLTLLTYAYSMGQRTRLKVMVLVGVPILALALLGTGQRAFLIYSFIALFFGLNTLFRISIRRLIFLSAVVVLLFAYITIQYKWRHLEGSENVLLAAMGKLLERAFVTEQLGSVVAYRILYLDGIVYFEDWLAQLAGLLPYIKGSRVQHDLFFAMHGTDRGTHGFTTVVSTLYNGGIVSLVLFYTGLGSLYCWLYNRMLMGRRTIFRSMVYGYLFFYLSAFVSGGPSTAVNNGIVALLILLFLRKLRWKTRTRSGHLKAPENA